MNETRAMVVHALTPDAWRMIEAVAPVIHASRLFGMTSKEGAAAIMLKGYELGMGLAASFEMIHVVQGKPTLSPRGALALIFQSGLLDGMKIQDHPEGCTVWMRRKGSIEYTLTYTVEDARRAGVVKVGSAWETYGPNMCRWRAIGFVADVLFPDVMGGLKRADEMGADVDTDGNVITGEWTTVAAPVEPVPAPTAPAPTLDELVTRYGPDVVMNAAGGIIPGTDAEVAAVAAKLEGANVGA